jgi:hypothetical protein
MTPILARCQRGNRDGGATRPIGHVFEVSVRASRPNQHRRLGRLHMRIRSWLFMGIGYLAGTRAGRERFEDLKNSVTDLAQSDLVAEALGRTRQSLGLDSPESRDADGEMYLPEEEDEEVVLPEPEDASS